MMTVAEIIKAVRWCIDEEAVNQTGFADASEYDFDGGTHTDEGLMNNIIKNKIGAALRWVCLYAPAEQLSGSSSSGTIDVIYEETISASQNTLTPAKNLIRVIRVKGTAWHRAILGDSLIKEDSDEYLQLSDPNGAEATADRPQAALVNTKTKKVEVYPGDGSFTLTYIIDPDVDTSSSGDSDTVNVPSAVKTSFIYYLAYLLLTAYGDARAKSMFDVATLNLGKSEDKQRQ